MNGERIAFENWLGIKPCGAAHDLAWAAWQARASLPTQPAAQATTEPVRLAESVHEDNARVLQSILDELRMILGLKDGESITAAVRSLAAKPAQQAAGEPATIEDNSQQWQGMDGATAWHLIDRHADGWGDIAKMMGEWLKANTHPAPGVPEIDYTALIHAAWGKHKYAQGTGGCIAFKHGAEWFRDIALTAAQAKGGEQ